MGLLIGSSIPLPEKHPKDCMSHYLDTCTTMFTSVANTTYKGPASCQGRGVGIRKTSKEYEDANKTIKQKQDGIGRKFQ